jgi:hypothetical protein
MQVHLDWNAFLVFLFATPRLGPAAMPAGHSLGIPPGSRGFVLSEWSEPKDDGIGAPGLPGGATLGRATWPIRAAT